MKSNHSKAKFIVALFLIVALVLCIAVPRLKAPDGDTQTALDATTTATTEEMIKQMELLSNPELWGEESEILNEFKVSCFDEEGNLGALVDENGLFIFQGDGESGEIQTGEGTCTLCSERETSSKDNCVLAGNKKGKTCKTETVNGVSKKYCCDWTAAGKCECEKEYTNPCTDPIKCAACMILAESENEPAACKNAVACVIRNRMNANDNFHNFCDVVTQQRGDTTEFEPYKCVCDSGSNANALQTYCDCCADPDPSGTYGTPYDDALAAANSAGSQGGCQGSPLSEIDAFGANGEIPGGCTASNQVQVPGCVTGPSGTKFYDCA